MLTNKCCCSNQNNRYLSVPYDYCICGDMKNHYGIIESIGSLAVENDVQHRSISLDFRSKSVDQLHVSSAKKQSVDSTNVEMSTVQSDSQARSQTSLLTTISTLPTEPISMSPVLEYQQVAGTGKQTAVKSMHSSLVNHSKSAKSSSTSGNQSVTGHGYDKESSRPVSDPICYPSIVKSASVSGLVQFQAFEDGTCRSEIVDVDSVDAQVTNVVISSGDGKSSALKWNPALVDIETTEMMVNTLDEYIKSKRDQINKDVTQKEEMVDTLISNFTLKSDSKSSKKIRREYETMNKSAEKSLDKARTELEQLEYKRLIVSQEGIPWGVKPAEYVKNISKKDRKKKNADLPSKEASGPVTKLLKGSLPKSASAENVSQLIINKSDNISPSKVWAPKSENVKKSKELPQKYLQMTEDNPNQSSLSCDQRQSLNNPNQSYQKPNSVGNSSAMSWDNHATEKDFVTTMKKSQSNSVSSGMGRDHPGDLNESFRNQSVSVASVEEMQKSDEVSISRILSLQDEMALIKREIHEVRSECHRFQCETDNLRLDMNTHSELNSQKMQNAIERVDRLERILDMLKNQCQIEFCTWKDEFRNLEEKLDYRLTTTRRDLQDNIDTCNNSISLVEKRTEQLPFMANRSGRSDVKIITDHLCNLIVSLIAFIMLLISSGFHLLIRFLNIGATITQNRNTLLIPLIVLVSVLTVAVKFSLFSSLYTRLTNTDIDAL